MSQDLPLELEEFLAELRRQDAAPATVRNYAADLRAFARWFPDSTGEPFSARAVTPTDLREYKAYLRTVEQRQAATVNRRLAALRKFFVWAKGAGKIAELPTERLTGVPAAPRTPKALAKREVDRLLRAAEQDGNKRNLAILLTARHAGLRVGELCNRSGGLDRASCPFSHAQPASGGTGPAQRRALSASSARSGRLQPARHAPVLDQQPARCRRR